VLLNRNVVGGNIANIVADDYFIDARIAGVVCGK